MNIVDELAEAFLNQIKGMQSVFDSESGEIFIDVPESVTGEPEIDWDDEEAENLLPIPEFTSSEAYDLRKVFAHSLPEPEERASLLQALEQKKPFRHFRGQLETLEMMDDWFKFEEDYAKQRMADWLKEEGIYSKFIDSEGTKFD